MIYSNDLNTTIGFLRNSIETIDDLLERYDGLNGNEDEIEFTEMCIRNREECSNHLLEIIPKTNYVEELEFYMKSIANSHFGNGHWDIYFPKENPFKITLVVKNRSYHLTKENTLVK
jgi:hypothetical protein